MLMAMLQAFALRCRRLCSPPRFFATRALPVLARNQLPALSVASPLVLSTTNREPANYVLRMLAAGSLLAALVQPEAAECGGTKRKKGTVVEEFYEVDCIKARRIVKGGAVEYLIHWKGALSVCSRRRASSMAKTRRPKRMGPSSTASLPPPTPSRDERARTSGAREAASGVTGREWGFEPDIS
jgi:hypothetical protein